MEYRKIKDDEDKDEGTTSNDIESLGRKALVSSVSTSELTRWKRKTVVTLAFMVLTSSQAILIVWSKRAGKYEYSVTTANFLVETLKCALSLAALARIWKNDGVTEDNSPPNVIVAPSICMPPTVESAPILKSSA